MRAIFLALTVLTVCFIFSNSTKGAEQSSSDSTKVTVTVQEIVGAIDPDSPIATATGEDFDLLHSFIRSMAHCIEYTALGAFSFATYLSFTRKKRYSFIAPVGSVFVALLDEWTQTLTDGRAAELGDILLDGAGVLLGSLATLAVFGMIMLCVALHRRKKRKSEAENG